MGEEPRDSVPVKRRLIAKAIDAVGERYGLNRDRAFQYLVRACTHSGLELADVAREVVGGQTGRCSTATQGPFTAAPAFPLQHSRLTRK